jgi:hypothetical protein
MQASEREAMLQKMTDSFEGELRDAKRKAANEIEALSKKSAAEHDAISRKLADETAARVELDKKAK